MVNNKKKKEEVKVTSPGGVDTNTDPSIIAPVSDATEKAKSAQSKVTTITPAHYTIDQQEAEIKRDAAELKATSLKEGALDIPQGKVTYPTGGSTDLNPDGTLKQAFINVNGEVMENSSAIPQPTNDVKEIIALNASDFSGRGVLSTTRSFDIKTRTLVFRTTVPCNYVVTTHNLMGSAGTTGRTQEMRWVGPIMDDFHNLLTLWRSTHDLVPKLIKFYEGIPRDIPKEYNPFEPPGWSKMPKRDAIGSDLFPAIDAMNESEARSIKDAIRYQYTIKDQFRPDGTVYPIKKNYTAMITKFELKFWNRLNDSQMLLVLPDGYNRKYKFLKLLEDQWRGLAPPNPRIFGTGAYEDWYVLLHDTHKMDSPFRGFVDHPKNGFVREWLMEIFNQMINETMSFPLRTVEMEADTLAKMLELETNRISEANTIPTNLNSEFAETFVKRIILVTLLRKHMYLDVDISFDRYDFNVLMDCFLYKLFVSHWMLSENARNKIDNYIAVFFVKKITKFVTTISPTPAQLMNSNINYLTLMLQNRPQPAAVMTPISAFLLTGVNGDGWANAGSNNAYETYASADIPEPNIWMNDRSCFYPYYTGIKTPDWEQTSEQYQRFKSFADVIQNNVNVVSLIGVRNMTVKMSLMFQYIVQKEEQFSAMMYHINLRVRQLALTSLADPVKPADAKSHNLLIPIRIPRWSALSAVTLIKWLDMRSAQIDVKYIELGWRFHEFLDEFAAAKLYTDQFKKNSILTKSERLDLAFRLTSADPGFGEQLKKKVLDTPIVEEAYIPPPSSPYFSDRIAAAMEFIQEIHLDLGVSNSFTYHGRPLQYAKNAHLYAYFPPRADEIVREFDWEGLRDIVTTQFYTPLVESVEDDATAIKFNFPIKFKMVESTDLDYPFQRAFEYGNGDKQLSLNTLIWNYTYWDKYLNVTAPEKAHRLRPMWSLEKTPLRIGRMIDFFFALIHTISVYEPNFKEYNVFSFFPRDSVATPLISFPTVM